MSKFNTYEKRIPISNGKTFITCVWSEFPLGLIKFTQPSISVDSISEGVAIIQEEDLTEIQEDTDLIIDTIFITELPTKGYLKYNGERMYSNFSLPLSGLPDLKYISDGIGLGYSSIVIRCLAQDVLTDKLGDPLRVFFNMLSNE